MSDGSLTQEEIDALLMGADELMSQDTGGGGAAVAATAPPGEGLRSILETLKDSFVGPLKQNFGKEVTVKSLSVKELDGAGLAAELPGRGVSVKLNLTEDLKGTHGFFIPESFALALGAKMLKQEEIELNDVSTSAVTEAMSQSTGSMGTTIGDKYGKNLKTEPPVTEIVDDASKGPLEGAGKLSVAVYTLQVENQEFKLAEYFDSTLASSFSALGAGAPAAAPAPPTGAAPQAAPADTGAGIDALAGLLGPSAQASQAPAQVPSAQAQSVSFPQLNVPGVPPEALSNISLLLDVPMLLTVELGRAQYLIKEILSLGEGSIIELDKLAGEPVDILVNDKIIARGEVVVIDENFGVRVTDIVSPTERLKK